MFANVAGINGFLEKQLLKSQKSVLNAKALIGIRREKIINLNLQVTKMEAKETNFLRFLNSPKQLVIPIYQRTYSWKIKECEQLWKDILKAGSDKDISGHFIGSIVYVEKGLYQVSALPRLLVIDGQQRLTTLSLLLSALCNHIKG